MKLLPIVFAVLFAVAHTQSPLYYSNQNQYFLHGAAQAGVGDLQHDWLANTTDPTPILTAFVSFCLKHLGEWSFQATYFLVLMAYFLSAWWLVKPSWHSGHLFAAFFTLLHAGILRWASYRLLGADYPWFFHCGLASQYILGAGLQPSVAGVALFASVAAYRNGRPDTAACLAGGAVLIHATYLLPVLLLVFGYAVEQKMRGSVWKVVRLGLIGLVTAFWPIAYILFRFGPEGEQFGSAQRILAEVRIPHHTQPARWFDWVAGLQVLWMLGGLIALRHTRLFLPLCVTSFLAALGTLAVIVIHLPTLSLMFPWRISAVLVPVATAVLVGKFAERITRYSWSMSASILLACVGGGVAVYTFHLGYREPTGEDAALRFVEEYHKPGEVYLVPARLPKPTTSRGVYSNTFAEPPDPSAVVYFEMARFRLSTGAALYIDFKAIPYKDTEVMEWHRRVGQCVEWFKDSDWEGRRVVDEIDREGVTHVVAPIRLGLKSSRLKQVFEGGAYRVYEVKSPRNG